MERISVKGSWDPIWYRKPNMVIETIHMNSEYKINVKYQCIQCQWAANFSWILSLPDLKVNAKVNQTRRNEDIAES